MKQTVYFALAGALILAACAKEVVPAVVEEPNIDNKTTVYANVPETKTTQEDGVFSWGENEAIAVGGDASSTTQFYNFTCTDTENGEFTGSATDSRKVAISPSADASAFSIVGETFSYSLTLPESYAGYVSGTTNALMVGAPVGEDKYQFNHAAALLKVTYKNAPVGTTGLSLTSANHNITGTKAGLTSATGVSVAIADMTGNTVTYTLATTLAAVSDLEFYIPVPVGEYANFEFNINLTGSDTIASSTSKTLKGTKTLEAGDILNLQVIELLSGFEPATVGPNDNLYWIHGAIAADQDSDPYSIQPGQVLHIDFVNHKTTNSSDGNYNWFNWVVVVANNSYGQEGHFEYVQLRADYSIENFYMPYNAYNNPAGLSIDVPIEHWANNGEIFNSNMDNANVSISIERTTAGSLFIIAKSTSSNGSNTYTERYSQYIPATGNVVAFLRCFHSYFDIKKVWYTNSKKTITSLISDPCYLYTQDIPLSSIGATSLLRALYNNNEIAYVDPELLTDYQEEVVSGFTSEQAEGTEEEQNCTVTFNGDNVTLTVPKIKGKFGFGNPNLTDKYQNDSNRLFYATDTQSRKLFVYSLAGANDLGPALRLKGSSTTFYFRLDWAIEPGEYNLAEYKWTNWVWGDGYYPGKTYNYFQYYLNHQKLTLSVSRGAEDNGQYPYTITYNAQYACPSTNADITKFTQSYNIPIAKTEGNLQAYLRTHHAYVVLVANSTDGWPTN